MQKLRGRPRWTLALVVALLAAGAAGWMLWAGGQRAESAEGSLAPQDAEAGEPAPDAAEPIEPQRAPVDPAPAAPTPGEVEAPARLEPSLLAGELVRVSGAAIRVDLAGVERAGDDGRVTLRWQASGGPERRELEVLAGRFTAELPARTRLFASDLVLAGHELALEAREEVVPEDGFLVLRGRQLAEVALHVRSRLTGEELDGVEVWPARGPATEGAWTHPGARPDAPPVVEGERSPVRVPPRSDWRGGQCAYWVRADGHAYARVALDHGAGGEREVLLDPEARLDVTLVGGADWLDPLVRLWTPRASTWDAYCYGERKLDADGRARFDALAPGTYRVSAERGWADRRVSYGQAIVELAPGESRAVELAVELPDEPHEVRVSGTLALGPGWSAEGLRLVFAAQREAALWSEEPVELHVRDLAGSPEHGWAWETTLPCAGPYELTVEPRLARAVLDVPPEGLAGVRVEVPAAAEVEVRVVDEASGEELVVPALRWSPPRLEGVVATPTYTAVRDEARGCVVFRAPAGEVSLAFHDPSLALSEPALDDGRPADPGVRALAPGPNRIELRAQRRIGVRFTFRDGEATVPWSWSWRLRAERVDGAARDVARSIGVLWFAEEGAYELYSRPIPGYASIDGTPFEVASGRGVLEVEVPLRRE